MKKLAKEMLFQMLSLSFGDAQLSPTKLVPRLPVEEAGHVPAI